MPEITFDKSLPSTHEYLGADLEEIHGRTILDDDSYLSLPLLPIFGVVLVPGQTLPLHLYQPRDVAMIRRIIDKDKTFGQIAERYTSGSEIGMAAVGTTAEVLAFKDITDDLSGVSTAKVKAIGRQRFKVIDIHRQVDGIMMAKVRILPETVLPHPLEGAQPPSFRRPSFPSDASLSQGDPVKYRRKRKKLDFLSGSHFTRWPSWVYRQYDSTYLMEKIREELKSWNESFNIESMPTRDAVEFSYWVAGMLPLDDTMKLEFLQTDCAIQRLRSELHIMQKCTVLCCKHCPQVIANKRDVFSMSVDGPLGAYVNPHGHVHETLTTHNARGLKLRGRPSTEASWFPGYAWTIAKCKNCHSHMGWKFTKATNRALKPEKFWGLCRSSLQTKLDDTELETEEECSPVESSSSDTLL